MVDIICSAIVIIQYLPVEQRDCSGTGWLPAVHKHTIVIRRHCFRLHRGRIYAELLDLDNSAYLCGAPAGLGHSYNAVLYREKKPSKRRPTEQLRTDIIIL